MKFFLLCFSLFVFCFSSIGNRTNTFDSNILILETNSLIVASYSVINSYDCISNPEHCPEFGLLDATMTVFSVFQVSKLAYYGTNNGKLLRYSNQVMEDLNEAKKYTSYDELVKELTEVQKNKFLTEYENCPSQALKNDVEVKKIYEAIKKLQGADKWLDDLDILLGAGTKTKINNWISNGLSENKLQTAFVNSTDKAGLLNKLETSKSIYHQRVHIEDWDNIPGIMKSNYINNSLPKQEIPASNFGVNDVNYNLPSYRAATFTLELPSFSEVIIKLCAMKVILFLLRHKIFNCFIF